MRKIAILGILLTLSLFGTVITREDVISSASQYVPINNWTPEVDSTDAVDPTWHSWYKTLENGGNPPYINLHTVGVDLILHRN